MTPAPVFICGIARSGTTLLARLLDSHPALAVLPGETFFYGSLADRHLTRQLLRFCEVVWWHVPLTLLARHPAKRFAFRGRTALATKLTEWLGSFPNADTSAHAVVQQAASRATGPEDYWRAFLDVFEHVAKVDLRSKCYWVEKTPQNERFVPLSEQLFKSACRYLHILRDPRDAIASWLMRTPPATEAARQRSLVYLCLVWSKSVEWCRRNVAAYAGRYYALRYEDLVRHTSKVMSDICRFLDIPMDQRLLTTTRLGTPVAGNSSYPDATLEPGVVVQTLVHRYADSLTSAEIELIERLLGRQISACGYRLDRIHAWDRSLGLAQLPASVTRDVLSIIRVLRTVRRQRHYIGITMPISSNA